MTSSKGNEQNSNQPIRVVQVSDSHLFESEKGALLGLETDFSLGKVLDLVQKEQQNMDMILATGDLSQDGSKASYVRFKNYMDVFSAPVYWMPGNHDVVSTMGDVVGDPQFMTPCVIKKGSWAIIMLDSSISPDEAAGELAKNQLDFVAKALEENQNSHCMVVLHHHPIPYGSEWLDTSELRNPDEFFAITDQHPQLRAIVWGHVHQEMESTRKGVSLYSIPSTCVQFKPKSQEFAVDELNPGYRWFDLYPDGTIKTGVSRVVGVEFEVDYTIKGY